MSAQRTGFQLPKGQWGLSWAHGEQGWLSRVCRRQFGAGQEGWEDLGPWRMLGSRFWGDTNYLRMLEDGLGSYRSPCTNPSSGLSRSGHG